MKTNITISSFQITDSFATENLLKISQFHTSAAMDEPDADEQFFIFDVSDVQIVVPCLQNGISRMTYHGVCCRH